jgi:hypothetical protein
MSSIIPNTFQTPNAHVDRAMQYLSGDEYKVLNFAVRHIYGWHDSAAERKAAISLTTFEKGYTTKNGSHYGGVGLGRKTVVDLLEQLTKYGLLVRIGEATQKGQVWQIGETPDWDGLIQRANDKKIHNTARIQKARSSRAGGLSDNTSVVPLTTGLSDNTTGRVVAQTAGGLSDNTHINTYSNPSSNTRARNAKPPLWTVEELAISEAFGKLTNAMVKPHEEQTAKVVEQNRVEAALFVQHGITGDLLVKFYRETYTNGYTPSTLGEIRKKLGAWLAKQTPTKPSNGKTAFQADNNAFAKELNNARRKA